LLYFVNEVTFSATSSTVTSLFFVYLCSNNKVADGSVSVIAEPVNRFMSMTLADKVLFS